MSESKPAKRPAYHRLRRRRQAFVDAYILAHGVGAVAIRNMGYKSSRPDQIAWRFLQDPLVQEALEERRKDAIAKAGVDQLRVLEELCKLAYFQPKELVDENGNMLPLHRLKPEVAAALQGFEVEERMDGPSDDRRPVTRTKYRHPVKTESLKLLMQFLRMMPQQHEHTGKDGGPIESKDANPLSPVELARHIAFILQRGIRSQEPESEG